MSDLVPIKRALISVSDKTDLIAFAKGLARHGVQIISTGGTARTLADAGLAVTPVDQVTGFPEMMDGRVKTLHPMIHGGLLAIRDNADHAAAAQKHGIGYIDLVCVNLYPFEKTIAAKPDIADNEAIEQIDIGGPSMIRSAAKNHRFVTVVTDPSQYDRIVHDLDDNGGATTFALRRTLAGAAFGRTASYDTAIAAWMSRRDSHAPSAEQFPPTMILRLRREAELRYGENPHQHAAVYADPEARESNVVKATQLHGKQLSFNNLYDAAAALELIKEFDRPAAAVIKHTNPCGCGVADELRDAFERAYFGDALAAFGGIVAFNRNVDAGTAETITSGQKFLEVIIAPEFAPDALELLKARWQNVRLLAVGELPQPARRDARQIDLKFILGGVLAQQRDLSDMSPERWQLITGPENGAWTRDDLLLAWITAKYLKSNAVSIVRHGMLVGAGAGQMDRVESCRIAVAKAAAAPGGENRADGGVAGSDAFFPFRDGPDVLIKAGVKVIVQPGGSKRDDETIQACKDAGVTLYFTGERHFRH